MNIGTDRLKESLENKELSLNTRFGVINYTPSKSIYFAQGLYGFQPDLRFILTNFPNPKLDKFKILQCIDDESISLPVLPISFDNKVIDAQDMNLCLETIEADQENFAMMLIAFSKKDLQTGEYKISVNAKAPIIIDTNRKVGMQHIFTSNKYETRQNVTK